MKAVIVAAGKGVRLEDLTNGKPKCLLEIGNKTLIERSLKYLKKNNVRDVAIVVGYKKEHIMDHLGNNVNYFFNPFYDTTSDMASLWFAKSFVNAEPFLYLHSDLLYHQEIIKKCVNSEKATALMVDKKKCGDEEMKYIEKGGCLVESSKDISIAKAHGEWIGINKFSSEAGQKLFKEIEEILYGKDFNAYDTVALTRMARKGIKLPLENIAGLPWIEIDFPYDWKRAQEEIYPKIEDNP